MITDDHKTHAPAANPMPDGTQPVFPNLSKGQKLRNQPRFHPSRSTTDLPGLEETSFNPQYMSTPSPFGMSPSFVSGHSSSPRPRSLSRQASPAEFAGPSSKRRKHSGSGKLPSELTMTRLENNESSSSLPANISTISNGLSTSSARPPSDKTFAPSMTGQFANASPAPNSSELNSFVNQAALANHQLASTLGSRPGSPGGPSGGPTHRGFQDQAFELGVGQLSSTSHIWPSSTNGGNRLPSIIHKLVPSEGSITGGTEVTLLGSGFYPGMEVVFGDTLATTTTFWGDKCLNCLTPPALQPGLVPVVFKHEHPTLGQVPQPQLFMPKRQLFFRYVDDRELQMYRLALGVLGYKLGNQADALQTARQIMGSDPNSLFSLQKDYQGGSGAGNQRQLPGLESQGTWSELDSKMLTYLEFVDLDDSPRPARYNWRSSTGQTMLHLASSLGLTRFVAGLLARGANPEVQDNIGNTPMHLAALNGHAHIVHRLRLAGADANTGNFRGYTPADMATTVLAYQAALISPSRYRSRSVGSLNSSRRRRHSSTSLNSLHDTSSTSSESFGYSSEDSDDVDESEVSEDDSGIDEQGLYYTHSRRASSNASSSQFFSQPNESGVQRRSSIASEKAVPPEDGRGFSPPAAIIAWRNQLATQINQFQQSVANVFPNIPALPNMPALPNIPALPPLPALPDYQAHPMMRRITNLVPHRPNAGRQAREGWWDLLKGNSASNNGNHPPSYDELYPHSEQAEKSESGLKKASVVQAAADAALDQHFESQTQQSSSEAPSTGNDDDDIKDIRIGRCLISKEQQKKLREQQARRMKGLASDRNLYFIWVSYIANITVFSKICPRANMMICRFLCCYLLLLHILFRIYGKGSFQATKLQKHVIRIAQWIPLFEEFLFLLSDRFVLLLLFA